MRLSPLIPVTMIGFVRVGNEIPAGFVVHVENQKTRILRSGPVPHVGIPIILESSVVNVVHLETQDGIANVGQRTTQEGSVVHVAKKRTKKNRGGRYEESKT